MKNRNWIERQSKNPEARKRYEQERLILRVTEKVAEVMHGKGLSQADIADTLEVSPAHISQLLSGQRNMTLRTLASLAFACDMRVSIAAEPLREGEFINYPVEKMTTRTQQVSRPERGEQVVSSDHLAA